MSYTLLIIYNILWLILVSIALSKIDNKTWKTKYWNMYSIWLFLMLIWIIFLPLMVVGDILMLYGSFSILVEWACIEKAKAKRFKIIYLITIILAIILWFLFFVASLNFYEQISTIKILGFSLLIIKLILLLLFMYITYLFSIRLEWKNDYKSILAWILFYFYLPFLVFYKKLNNLTPCSKNKENTNEDKEINENI